MPDNNSDQGDGYPVERFRRNDYVGSPIWGFRGFPPGGAKVGDRCYYDDDLFTERDGKPYRTHYIVGLVDGQLPDRTVGPRLACLWADRWDRERGRHSFAGFIDA